jgi:hypothetical protein
VADILEKLSAGSSTDALMAYQIAFDRSVSATQQFLSRVLAAIRKTAPGLEEVTELARASRREPREQGRLLGAFFFGYVVLVTQLPGAG